MTSATRSVLGSTKFASIIPISKREQPERGFVLVIVAIWMFGLLLIAGLAVDLGSWYLTSTRMQRSADAAALAGAISLPNGTAGVSDANDSYRHNGFSPSNAGITVSNTYTDDLFTTTVRNTEVKTYFIKAIIPRITIARSASARKGNSAPELGSPYNVLGTGNQDIAGISERQDFWLAVNGMCSPAEDGDYFNARYDANKGPFYATQVAGSKDFNYKPGARHHCPPGAGEGVANPNFNANGYSYYVDVPPTPTGTVSIKIYDAAYSNPDTGTPDRVIDYPSDQNGSLDTAYSVFDIKDPENKNDDVLKSGLIASSNDSRAGARNGWITLYVAPSADIQNGARYRVQVYPYPYADANEKGFHGVNAFGLGAFKNNGMQGCDTRNDSSCPRVYGRDAISVYNNLTASSGNKVTYYFADINAGYVGRTMKLQLWDPGEGVERLEIIGPDGAPMTFNWTSTPTTTGYNGANVKYIDTSGTGPLAQPNLSNNYKFNDRLIVISLTIPSNYEDMITNSNGNEALSIRYTVNNSPPDRTTWGLTMDGDLTAPPRLVRPTN